MGDPFRAVAARLDVRTVPFTDRGSRILVTRNGSALAIRLAERNPKLDAAEGNYRTRRPVVDGLQPTDADGEPLPFSQVAEPHRLTLDTPRGPFVVAFQTPEVLAVTLPPGRVGLRFTARADRAGADRRGGTLHGPRNVAYTTSARVRVNEIARNEEGRWLVRLLVESRPGDAVTVNVTPRLGFDRRLRAAQAVRDAEERWRAWFDAAPPAGPEWQEAYAYAWWVMGAGLISSRFHFTREAMLPSKMHYVGVWQWDAYFHALAYRHVNADLAEDQFRIFFDHQHADGFLPDAVYDEGVVERLDEPPGVVTKPPLAAWGVWKTYEVTGDRDFLEETYETLARANDWWFAGGDGLCAYTHPYSSGLDDSPLWDRGMPVVSPDLNSYLVMHMDALGRIAAAIEMPEEAARWRERADRHLRRMIEETYDADAGLFRAYLVRDGTRLDVLTPFSLAPLWTGRLPREIADRLVANLRDPRTFWTPYPVPTVARSDPAYDPLRMWRGPTWAHINYLFVEGLRLSGHEAVAGELTDRTLHLLARTPDLREYYHPETGDPPPGAAPMQGWTAAVLIDLAIQRARGAV